MSYYLAPSLRTLRDQLDDLAPHRSKRSDGWIGDQAHRNRRSDHNPDRHGAVRAIDITHHPVGGMDCDWLSDQLHASRDPRIRYVIWDRQIFADYHRKTRPRWQRGPYTGSNPHIKHLHISVKSEPATYNNSGFWALYEPDPIDEEADMPIITKGHRGPIVKEIQRRLRKLRIDPGPVDGIYGQKTFDAVKRFQRDYCKEPVGRGEGGAGKTDAMTLAALTTCTSR